MKHEPPLTLRSVRASFNVFLSQGQRPGRMVVSHQGWEDLRVDMLASGMADVGEPSATGFVLDGVPVVCDGAQPVPPAPLAALPRRVSVKKEVPHV